MHRNLLTLLILTSPIGCAGPGAEPGAALGTAMGAIVNGTREPQAVALSEGQKLAIGWLHQPGWPGGNFCTGTLITPNVVATASHCTEGSRAADLAFSVGLDPSDPLATFNVAALHEAPGADAALLVLDRDAVAALPQLVPIAANLEIDPTTMVGRDVQAGGYGQTNDPGRSGRWFATVRLVEVSGGMVHVDGGGRQGICFGDSGSGVISTDRDGQPVVLGVESNGDPSCVGRDNLTRLDALRDWVVGIAGAPRQPEPEPAPEPPAAEPPAAEPPPAEPPETPAEPSPGCGGVDYLGACRGQVAVFCDGGELARVDCAASGQICGYVDDEVGYFCVNPEADACGGVRAGGLCEGEVAVYCARGVLVEDDCAARGGWCAVGAEGVGCELDDPPPPGEDRTKEPQRGLPQALDEPAGAAGEAQRHARFEGGCSQAPSTRSALPFVFALLLMISGAARRRRPEP